MSALVNAGRRALPSWLGKLAFFISFIVLLLFTWAGGGGLPEEVALPALFVIGVGGLVSSVCCALYRFSLDTEGWRLNVVQLVGSPMMVAVATYGIVKLLTN